MEDSSNRTSQEVLDDHLNLSEHWGAEEAPERIVEEDMRRNVSEDIVILSNRGAFRGHDGVKGSWRGCSTRNCPNTVHSSTQTSASRGRWRSWSGPTRTTA